MPVLHGKNPLKIIVIFNIEIIETLNVIIELNFKVIFLFPVKEQTIRFLWIIQMVLLLTGACTWFLFWPPAVGYFF